MKYDMTHVLPLMYPGVRWVLNGDQYKGLDWPKELNRPTEQEILDKIAELNAAEPMRLLRIERNRLLGETDWVTLRAHRTGQPVPAEWATYQQALADLPATADPKLNEQYELDMDSVVWPTKPVNT